MRGPVLLCALGALAACGSRAHPGGSDGGRVDGAVADTDGGGVTDAGVTDGGVADAGGTDSGVADAGLVDLDQDGLDDDWETAIATAYLPYVSFDPGESCGHPDGFAVRVFPHPSDATRPPRFLEIRYDHLYQDDCGLSGHVGDDENIAITADTSLPPPQGIMVIAAISHRNTACEHDSWCVQQSWSQSPCSGYAACDHPAAGSNRDGYPVVYVSKDKHGDYTTTNGCTFGCDFGACGLSVTAELPPLVNVGEPGHPLVSDLTTQGFITSANGWTEAALMDYDPWGGLQFGGAGTVSADLTDAALDTPICQ